MIIIATYTDDRGTVMIDYGIDLEMLSTIVMPQIPINKAIKEGWIRFNNQINAYTLL